jgi:hypothetical protein
MRRSSSTGLLPAEDPVIDALDTDQRQRIAHEWLRRAEVELTAATFTAQIVRGLLLDGAIPEVLDLAARAVADEVSHGRICHQVGERYLGAPAPPPRSRPAEEPIYGDCPPALSRLLALVMHSCINETLATVCLRDTMRRCHSPTARAATKRLLSDDLNHARMGWAHLASPFVDAEARHHVGRALPTLLRLGHEGWLHEPRAAFDDPAHGVLGPGGFPGPMTKAFEDLVLPGFEHVGVDTREARAWFARDVGGKGLA